MKPTDLSELKSNAGQMAQRLKVMSHPERLVMTGLSQSGVSQHLALLRAEDIVTVRIDANTRWYSLKDRIVSGVIHALCDLCEPNARCAQA